MGTASGPDLVQTCLKNDRDVKILPRAPGFHMKVT